MILHASPVAWYFAASVASCIAAVWFLTWLWNREHRIWQDAHGGLVDLTGMKTTPRPNDPDDWGWPLDWHEGQTDARDDVRRALDRLLADIAAVPEDSLVGEPQAVDRPFPGPSVSTPAPPQGEASSPANTTAP